MMAGVLVWGEPLELERELLGQARRVCGQSPGEVSLFVDHDLDEAELASFGASGADVVYVADAPATSLAGWVDGLEAVIARTEPTLLLIGATKNGMEVAARLSERLQAAYGAWAVGIDVAPGDGAVTARCSLYAGSAMVSYRFAGALTVLTVAQGVFDKAELAGHIPRSESLSFPRTEDGVSVTGHAAKKTGGDRVGQARMVVDIGRGVKDLETVRSLASLLEAQLGCSRPVSSDRDWLPDWLGLSGAKIKAELCMTIGISGAVQHVVGIRDSRLIAAVNNDENAPIFTQCDFGVVADLDQFVPVLIERLQQRGAHVSDLAR
jgi:electron transfer flavoprotein alpha subunit